MAADDSGASPAPAGVRRDLRRTIAVAVAVTLVLLALAVWPVPMLWRGPSLSAGARVLLRDPADLRLPTTEAGTVAATVIAPWQEPVRLGDRCARRVVVSMAPGWKFVSILPFPGWRLVGQTDTSATIEIASGADRIARATFVGSDQLPVPEVSIEVQRACDGRATHLGTLTVVDVVDETPEPTATS